MVIKARHIDLILLAVGETEGFIAPIRGFKALYLIFMINLLSKTKLKYSFETKPMFVMDSLPKHFYLLAHQVHHWMAYSKGLPGYEETTTDNFKNIWSPNFGEKDIEKMSVDEILALKDAITRDIEAINFVKEISQELICSKRSLNKLKAGKSINI